MTRKDVDRLITRLELRASWYERPADFRAGVREMARCCEQWLLQADTSADVTPTDEKHGVRVG